MAKILGQHLRLFTEKNGEMQCIAAATNNVIHISADVAEDTTKDSDGDWIENGIVSLNWDTSADALVLINDAETAITADDLLTMMEAEIPIYVKFSTAAGQNNRVAQNALLSGYAIISDFSTNAAVGEDATYTVQLQGVGDLSIRKTIVDRYAVDGATPAAIENDVIRFTRAGGNVSIRLFTATGIGSSYSVRVESTSKAYNINQQADYTDITLTSSFSDKSFAVIFGTGGGYMQRVEINM